MLEEQYASYLSDYPTWDQRDHAEDYVVLPENIGRYLSIDETSLSQGELYTIITNKEANGQKGAILAILKGVNSDDIVPSLLRKIPLEKRRIVKEVTLDMAGSMNQIVSRVFTKATKVTDRFHVQKLAYDALQEMRINYRWEAIAQENEEINLAKELGEKFIPNRLDNGDTHKQLLAEVDIYYSSLRANGLPNNTIVQRYYSDFIQNWKKLTS